MNNDLISRSALKQRKFVINKFVRIGGRTNGKTLESINKAYQQGWNDAIDAIIDNEPTVTPDMAQVLAYESGKSSERPKGKWIKTNDYVTCAYGCIDYVKCSCCKNDSLEEGDYCPNCGADMRGGQDNDPN